MRYIDAKENMAWADNLKTGVLRSALNSMKPLKQIAFLVAFAGLNPTASATLYQVQIDQSQWQLQSSPFACRLTHQVPEFGSAVLERGAGEAARFWWEPLQSGLIQGNAQVYIAPPAWLANRSSVAVESINIDNANSRLQLSDMGSAKVLASLRSGLQPTLNAQSSAGETVKVAVSAANFAPAFQAYSECLSQLLPVNFNQIARTAILYPPAQWELSQASRERLELVKTYVETDNKIAKIYVDGHSDNQGRRLLNRDLSKRRAEEVTRYLVQLGVNEEMLVTRYHGERYPVVPNNSADNRTRNRRVTIRLERLE